MQAGDVTPDSGAAPASGAGSHEDEWYKPSAAVLDQAYIKDWDALASSADADFRRLLGRASQGADRLARALEDGSWTIPTSRSFKWFVGARTNIVYNAIDSASQDPSPQQAGPDLGRGERRTARRAWRCPTPIRARIDIGDDGPVSGGAGLRYLGSADPATGAPASPSMVIRTRARSRFGLKGFSIRTMPSLRPP